MTKTLHWRKMFNIGYNFKQEKRMKAAQKNKDVKSPDLIMLIKDHKEARKDGTCLPSRSKSKRYTWKRYWNGL